MKKLYVIMILSLISVACADSLSKSQTRDEPLKNEIVYLSLIEKYSGVKKQDWLDENLPKIDDDKINWQDPSINTVSDAFIYMVPVNKLIGAVKELKWKDAVEIPPRSIKTYAGKHYQEEKGKTAFLVRAMYENFTGRAFSVKWHPQKKTLRVHYSSLGGKGVKFFSPLVVNLEEKPERIVFSYHGGI